MTDRETENSAEDAWISEDEADLLAKLVLQKEQVPSASPALPKTPQTQPADPLAEEIRSHIRFRLMGYGLDGKYIPWDKDVGHVQRVESQLVIKPQELKEFFDKIRSASTKEEKDAVRSANPYQSAGYHAYGLLADTLYRVRKEGNVLLAGIEDRKGIFHPVAYNYGLDSMPEDDQEFESLALDTLAMAPDEKKEIDTRSVYMNWRTGVLGEIDAAILRDNGVPIPADQEKVSMRRMGIASALKYIFLLIAEWRKKESTMFNIGTIIDWHNREEKIRNKPSFEHNRRIFEEELMYRNRPYHMIIHGEKGDRTFVAKFRWFARRGQLQESKSNLLQPESSLVGKGWDPHMLEELVHGQIIRQLKKDKNKGDHI